MKIEITERVVAAVPTPAPGKPRIVEEVMVIRKPGITDPKVIDQIVAALDRELPLGPLARCSTAHMLRFHLDDGTVQSIGYGCDPENPSTLRGGQSFWGGQQVEAPGEFNELLQTQLASTNP